MKNWLNFSANKIAFWMVSCLLLFVLAGISLSLGANQIPLKSVVQSLMGKLPSELPETRVMLYVRLPRTLAAMLAGSALAVSGAILQQVFLNPMAAPGIIGVNAGSGFFVLLSFLLFPFMPGMSPLFAFIGALIACLLIYWIGQFSGASRLTLILTGVAVSSLFSALSDTMLTLFPDLQVSRTAFLIGGLNGVNTMILKFAAPIILIGLIFSFLAASDLNVLGLGDEVANSLGANVKRLRLLVLLLASLLAGAAVSLTGLIGFAGLIVPHMARALMGTDMRLTLPGAAVLGAALLLVCDMLARILFVPYELPVGILLSFLGVPFFLFLILRQRKERSHD